MNQIIVIAVLGLLGYLFGSANEKKHYNSIKKRELGFLNLPATSLKKPLSSDRIVAKTDLATGSVVISIDYFKRLYAALINFFGGNVTSYETLIDRARREAVLRLKEEAKRRGADEIMNLRVETSSISQSTEGSVGSVEVLAYATLVYYAKRV